MPEDSTSGVSDLGSYMRQLADLQKSDPDQFKEKAAEIAKQLEAAATEASNSGDSKQAEMLSDLANRFSTSAESGEMPDLTPPGGGQPPMGPPPGPPPDSSLSSSSEDTEDTWQVSNLYQQSSYSDPLSVLSDVLANIFSSSSS